MQQYEALIEKGLINSRIGMASTSADTCFELYVQHFILLIRFSYIKIKIK